MCLLCAAAALLQGTTALLPAYHGTVALLPEATDVDVVVLQPASSFAINVSDVATMEHDIATDEPTILPGRPPRHHLLSAARRRRDAPARRDAVVAARMLPWPEGAATVVAA